MDNVGLFVDVQNIYYTTRHSFDRQFNYRALWEELSLRGAIVQAYGVSALTAISLVRAASTFHPISDALLI